MKKKKFSLLLNIATIALCVCAIAIGVYSAKQASLTVSGSIGFEAHDCIVEISGTYSAYTSSTAETRTSTPLTTTTVGGKTSSDYAKSLPITSTLYFSDMATDGHGDEIVFSFTITNKSDFKITVKAPAPTLKNASEQDIAGVTCSSSEPKFDLEAQGQTGASKTITLTYKLNDIDNATDIPKTSKFNISLSFAKYQAQFYKASITEYFSPESGSSTKEITTQKLCTTMGHSIKGSTAGTDGETVVPIQWYAFAVKGVNTGKSYLYDGDCYDANTNQGEPEERWYSLNGINFNDNLEMELTSGNVSSKGKTFWFIQQYVVGGGYYMGTEYSSQRAGIAFDDSSNDYPNSDIYTFLTTTDEVGYITKTGIKESDLYEDITTRNISDIYSNNNGPYTRSFSAKLWLINCGELGLIADKQTYINSTGAGYPQTTGIGNQERLNNYGSSNAPVVASWWLRIALYDDSFSMGMSTIKRVDGAGFLSEDSVYMSDKGVRAAFEVTL